LTVVLAVIFFALFATGLYHEIIGEREIGKPLAQWSLVFAYSAIAWECLWLFIAKMQKRKLAMNRPTVL
jgi:energy-converting hydrogenase Eha subunit G